MDAKKVVSVVFIGAAGVAGLYIYNIVHRLLGLKTTIGKPYFKNGNLYFSVRMDNPLNQPVSLDGYQGKIYVNGVYVADIYIAKKVKIPAGGTQMVDMVVPVDLGVISRIPSVLSNLSNALNVKIDAKVKSGLLQLPYSQSFQIPLA